MILYPNAKINLGLNVVERRPDGYHDIETVFYPISLCDVLSIEPSATCTDYSFSTGGIPVGGDAEDNFGRQGLPPSATRMRLAPPWTSRWRNASHSGRGWAAGRRMRPSCCGG